MKQSEAKTTKSATKGLMPVLVMDIETWSGKKPSLEDLKPKANLVDPVKIQKDLEEKQDKAWRAQSLDPFLGEVYCVAIKINEEKTFVLTGETEKELIKTLDDVISAFPYPTVVAHFGETFDFPFLFTKGLKYKAANVVNVFSGKGSSSLVDTAKIIRGTNYRAMISLDKMTYALTGKKAKGEIHGSDVHDLIVNGKGKDVCDYCIKDTDALYNSYKTLVEFGLV